MKIDFVSDKIAITTTAFSCLPALGTVITIPKHDILGVVGSVELIVSDDSDECSAVVYLHSVKCHVSADS